MIRKILEDQLVHDDSLTTFGPLMRAFLARPVALGIVLTAGGLCQAQVVDPQPERPESAPALPIMQGNGGIRVDANGQVFVDPEEPPAARPKRPVKVKKEPASADTPMEIGPKKP